MRAGLRLRPFVLAELDRCILACMRIRWRIELFGLAMVAPILAIGCHKPTPGPQSKARFTIDSGDEWRSWSPAQRTGYVEGFLDGRLSGLGQACDAADWQSYDIPGGSKLSPEMVQLCQQKIKTYTRFTPIDQLMRGAPLDVTAYTSVLDAFYAHPECRVMPFPTILNHLNDEEYMSGDELYEYLRGGANPGGRGKSWGFFTGFDGMDKCYGADRR